MLLQIMTWSLLCCCPHRNVLSSLPLWGSNVFVDLPPGFSYVEMPHGPARRLFCLNTAKKYNPELAICHFAKAPRFILNDL